MRSAAPRRVRALLDPLVQDTLPLAGVGTSAQLRRAGDLVVKIAHPTAHDRRRVRAEARVLARIQHTEIAPRLFAVADDGSAFVRAWIEAPTLLEVVRGAGDDAREDRARLERLARDHDACDAIARTFAVCAWVKKTLRVQLDFSPPNLVLVRERGRTRCVLLDAGARLAPPVLRGVTRVNVVDQLARYLAWKRGHAKARTVERMVFPPSARFHVEVPVGRAGPLLWRNDAALARMGLVLSDAELFALGGHATWAAPAADAARTSRSVARARTARAARPARAALTLPASRYLDDARGLAKGDGRSVYAGVLTDGHGRRRELMIKGAGPTPLAWKGHAYHEDGFVSFQRTLWEAAVSDELCRLGFDTPEIVAVFAAPGQSTIDNTNRAWPAASALRASPTHWRLGHLLRWRDDPRAARVVVAEAMRALGATSATSLARTFAANLGADLGRAEAMNILCFNPTAGNVRLDGHPLDFSTVRFFRHDAPHYALLEGRRRAGGQRDGFTPFVHMLVHALAACGAIAKPQRDAVRAACFLAYERAYVRGYCAGLSAFYAGPLCAPLGRSSALVSAARALKELRADDTIEFPFFQQHDRAPLFDLVGRAVEFVAALRAGQSEPWRALRSEFAAASVDAGGDDDAHREARARGEAFVDAFVTSLRTPVEALRPQRWRFVIRASLEVNALAAICYARSTPRSFAAWQRALSTSRALPLGRHRDAQAQALARACAHVSLPPLVRAAPAAAARAHRTDTRVVVGVTPGLAHDMREAIARVVKDAGAALVGVVVHGSRVMARDEVARRDPAFARRWLRKKGALRPFEGVREWGPDPALSSDLDLKVFVRTTRMGGAIDIDALARALGAALDALGARIPLTGHDPARARVIVTRVRTLRAAFRAYNAARTREHARPAPIPEIGCVVLA